MRLAWGDRPDPGPAAQPDIGALSKAPPFLVLSWDGSAPTARGAASCVLGGEPGPTAGERLPTGVHAQWRWDGRRLVVRTDRFGFQPLFYAVSGATLWLSPSLPELVRQGAPSELDDGGLAVFLRLGHFLADDTPFLHIRAVPPAAVITWEAGRVRVDGARTVQPRREMDREVAIGRYVELFRGAMEHVAADPRRTVVPLSGGRDSRHILLELQAAGRPPACVTVRPVPPKSDEDARVAAALAAAVGVPHTIVEPTEDRCQVEVEKNLLTSLCTFEHGWVMDLARSLAGRELVLYDGIAGDTLSEAKYMNAARLELFRRNDLRRYAAEELGSEGYLPVVLRPDAYRRFSRALALERLEAELRTHVDAPNPVGSYRFWNRTRRAVGLAPFGLLASVATVRAPFLDDDLHDFLASLPGEMLVDRTFHSATIARAYPAFAAVPYENPGAPRRSAAVLMQRFGIAALARDIGRRLRRVEPTRQAVVRHAAYTARLAALLAARRAENAISLATMGLYLSQVEEIASRR